MFRRSVLLVAFVLLLPTFTATAQNSAARATAKPDTFRAEFLADVNDLEEKLVALANATPADKFGWRPGKGVRSISEVYMHIAGSNYFLATFVGMDAPKMEKDLEKTVTKKSEVIAEMRKSFAHLRAAVNGVTDLETSVMMFGKQTTHHGVLVTMLKHLSEHFGQAVAYVRMNGLVPPWSGRD